MIAGDGKLQSASGTRIALRKAAAYRTGFITLLDFAVGTRHLDNLGSSFSYELTVSGHLKSNAPLKRCFIVLELTSGKDRGLFYNELPDLVPGESRELHILARLQEPLESGRYIVDVFSDGLELLNSKMSPLHILQETRKTEELMLKKTPDRTVFLDSGKPGVAPVYPAALAPKRLTGSVLLRCTVSPRGDVTSAEVVRATHGLFGEAALAAVRQWKFEAAIKDHHYVEDTVMVPGDFTPPAVAGQPCDRDPVLGGDLPTTAQVREIARPLRELSDAARSAPQIDLAVTDVHPRLAVARKLAPDVDVRPRPSAKFP